MDSHQKADLVLIGILMLTTVFILLLAQFN